MSENDESENINKIKRITADEEYKLEVNGYKCPDSYVTQFTPLEFEEVTFFSFFFSLLLLSFFLSSNSLHFLISS